MCPLLATRTEFIKQQRKGNTMRTKRYHNKNSKSTAILEYLIEGNSINSVISFKQFNTTRLSSVIKYLRSVGYHIDTYYIPNSRLGQYKAVGTKNWDLFFKRNLGQKN